MIGSPTLLEALTLFEFFGVRAARARRPRSCVCLGDERGIAMLGLALLFSMGSSYVAAEGGERVALFLAQQRLEELRAVGLARAVAEAERPVPGVPGFLRSTTITVGPDLDGSGDVPRIITVSVRSLVRQAGPINVTASYFKH